MNMRLYLFCIVMTLIFTVSPHAIGKIDPATVAGLWLFEEGGGEIAKDSFPTLETTVLSRDQKNGKKVNSVVRWNLTVIMSMLR